MTIPTKRLAREPTEEMWRAAENNMAALNERGQFPDFFDTWRAMFDAAEPEPGALHLHHEARAAALEEAAKLIEEGFHIQHPAKPAGVSIGYIEGDARRAAAIRALTNRSAP